ncbi:MAG: hypothetical protein PVI26_11740 [Chitinispirillia bacterium]|jgi:hypothetical protein
MKNTGNGTNQELDRICMNCNYFFPYLEKGPSEYGLCLKDSEFDPYIDELLEKQNYKCCKELIEEKKFDGNREPCKDFEIIEVIEDDISVDDLFDNKLQEQKEIQILDILLKYQSIERYKNEVNSPETKIRLSAFENLAGLVGFNNKEAAELLIKSFKELPAPSSLDEVHFKLKVFRLVNREEFTEELIPTLVRDLYNTQSNNRTRQWISEIFRFFSIYNRNEKIRGYLEKMLKEKQFSYRIKNKIKEILYTDDSLYF